MSALTNMWRQLVQRRLWPVAILLIAALVAVPLTLAKEPDAAPAPPPAPSVGKDELAVAPIVTAVSTTDRSKRRRVLGTAKNPFAVVKPEKPAVVTARTSEVTRTETVKGGEPAASSPTGAATSPTTSVPVTETPAAPATPVAPTPVKKTYDKYDLTVRFGEAASGSGRETLKRLQPLPSADQPVLIYMGVGADGKTAIFLLDHDVEAVGDGKCKPSPDACETIRLRAGDTEFLDVKDAAGNVTAQYQLDLVKIHKSTTTSAAEAKASYAGSKAGRRLLRARVSADGPVAYRWNDATGTLEARPEGAVVGTVERAVAQLP
jgi:hypothetical protein